MEADCQNSHIRHPAFCTGKRQGHRCHPGAPQSQRSWSLAAGWRFRAMGGRLAAQPCSSPRAWCCCLVQPVLPDRADRADRCGMRAGPCSVGAPRLARPSRRLGMPLNSLDLRRESSRGQAGGLEGGAGDGHLAREHTARCPWRTYHARYVVSSRSLPLDGMTRPSRWRWPETMAIPTQLVLPFGPGASASSRCGGEREGTVRCQGGELPPSRRAWSQLSLLGGRHVLGHGAASSSWNFHETRNRAVNARLSRPVFDITPSVYCIFRHTPLITPAGDAPYRIPRPWKAPAPGGAEASHHGWSTHPLPRPKQAHTRPHTRTRRSIGWMAAGRFVRPRKIRLVTLADR
jgi:hypothetical protein